MILEDQKYLDMLNLIMNGKHYREIAKIETVSKNTVSHMIKRLKTTGSIFPSISKTKTNELIRLCENTLKDNFLNIVHLPGEEIQFDWGTINIQIGDKSKSTQVMK